MSFSKESVKTIKDSYKLFIGGKWVESKGQKIDVYCPANGQKISEICDATNDEVNQAVDSAWKAFQTWGKSKRSERVRVLRAVADRLEEHAEELAEIETLDNGKPIRETRAIDVAYSIDQFRYFASLLEADEGEVNNIDGNLLSLVVREPIGVVGQIVPWN